MASTIQNFTNVMLLKAPITDYQIQLDFANKTEQYNYFSGLKLFQVSGLTYQRTERYVQWPAPVDTINSANYIMFQNSEYQNPGKWWYGFITGYQFVSDMCTNVYFVIDEWQTWQFDIEFKECLVEREHCDVSNTISVEESVDLGNEFVCRQQERLFAENDEVFIVSMSKAIPDILDDQIAPLTIPQTVGGVPQCVYYYLLENASDISAFYHFINSPASGEEISILSTAPIWTKLVPEGSTQDWINNNETVSTILNGIFGLIGSDPQPGDGSLASYMKYQETYEKVKERSALISNSVIQIFRLPYNPNVNYTVLSSINDKYPAIKWITGGGLPENSSQQSSITNNTFSEPKLNYYPFTYYKMTDHKGNSQIIKPEYCPSPSVTRIAGFNNPVKIRYWINNYQGGINTDDMSIVNSNNSTLPVANDTYGGYLMGNATQDATIAANSLMSFFSGAVNAFSGVNTSILNGVLSGGEKGGSGGAVLGGVAGGLQGLTNAYNSTVGGGLNAFITGQNIFAKRQDVRQIPPTIVGGSGNPSFEIQDNNDGVWIEKWTVNDVHANILTGYFKRFGYAINQLKVPNFKGRNPGNFCKTGGAIITGNAPTSSINVIKSMFDNGTYIYHNPWNVGSF